MPEANAGINTNARTIAGARSLENSENRADQLIMSADPYAKRKPEYYIGIFNVSKTPFVVPNPWAVGGFVRVEGREENAVYSKPFIINDVERVASRRAGSDEILLIPTKGELLAQDIVNNNDPYGDWTTYRALNPATAVNEGTNHYELGVFWVKLETPESEPDMAAVEMAIKRMEIRYNKLVQDADKMFAGGPKTQAFIGEPHHEAAEYFGIDRSWHVQLTGGLLSKLKSKK